MTWAVEFTPAALRAVKRLPRDAQARIVEALDGLAADPLAARNVKRLSGRDEFRLRVGDHRVLYDLEREVLVVRVVDADDRREVYR